MTQPALTRAGTVGPLVAYLKRNDASIARIFRAADLPLRICDRPGLLIPLDSQLRLVKLAARELAIAPCRRDLPMRSD